MAVALPVLTIQTPCEVPWEGMHGDDRVRFCSRCERQVFDLSNMTSDEVSQLLGDGDSLPCVRFYRRSDGRVMTADCPLNIRERTWNWLQRRAAWAAALFATLCLPACRTQTQGMIVEDFQRAPDSLPKTLETDVKATTEQQHRNPLEDFAGNEFNSWSAIPLFDVALYHPQAEIAPMPHLVEKESK